MGSTRSRAVRLRRNDATVRIGGTTDIPEVLRSLGADPATVLAEAGFDLKLFDDPETLVSFAARNRLMAHCAARPAALISDSWSVNRVDCTPWDSWVCW